MHTSGMDEVIHCFGALSTLFDLWGGDYNVCCHESTIIVETAGIGRIFNIY